MESRDVIICICYSLPFCGCLRGPFPKTEIEYSTTGLSGGNFDLLVKVSEPRYRKLMASSSVTAQGFMCTFPNWSATGTSSVKGLGDTSSLDHSGSLMHASSCYSIHGWAFPLILCPPTRSKGIDYRCQAGLQQRAHWAVGFPLLCGCHNQTFISLCAHVCTHQAVLVFYIFCTGVPYKSFTY